MKNNFFSMILRMKYINRWGLMRNIRQENLSEHSLDVAIILKIIKGIQMKNNFFSMILRMKYINRWGLMRNIRQENLSEHSLDVAIISHGIAVIYKNRLGGDINLERVALIAIFHDASEIITGDLPTPIKYYDKKIMSAYKEIENVANNKLLDMLPDDLRSEYEDIFMCNKNDENDKYIYKIIKAADKISAYIKCLEEQQQGNKDFDKAKSTILSSIRNMHMKEVDIFMDEFINGFLLTLDEQ